MNKAWPLQSSLLKNQSKKGRFAYSLSKNLAISKSKAPPEQFQRKKKIQLPELTEFDVVRHYHRLSHLNYSIDGGFYPLGSCTMKYNPRINEVTASKEEFLNLHPKSPEKFSQGALEIIWELQNLLASISGFKHVSLQPAAGAQGEYAGMRMIRKCLDKRGNRNNTVIVPESAHGTNCATAAICGFKVLNIPQKASATLTLSEIAALCDSGEIAALMVTNPNTLGIFEKDIQEITKLLHEKGALVYCDGANLNAMLGVTRPGDAGFDVMHFNQHKTFTTPHGGGGPGCGAIGVAESLEDFIPTPVLNKGSEGLFWDYDRPLSIGPLKDFYGHFLMMLRSYTYIRELGAEGIQKVGEHAILLANYVRKRLQDHYTIAYDQNCMHEVIFNDSLQLKNGITALDISKKLIDYGFHPPTMYFPLVVAGALMIEPTETESLDTIDSFCDAMIDIAQKAQEKNAFEKHFKDAPHTAAVARINETKAARELKLTWNEL